MNGLKTLSYLHLSIVIKFLRTNVVLASNFTLPLYMMLNTTLWHKTYVIILLVLINLLFCRLKLFMYAQI